MKKQPMLAPSLRAKSALYGKDSFVKRQLVLAVNSIRGMQSSLFGKRHMQKVFSNIFAKNGWGDAYSVSGEGSNLEQTKTLIQELPILLEKLGIQTMLDIPCGDFLWMKEVPLSLQEYVGGDIVPELISSNTKLYADTKKKFTQLDITYDKLPKVDLVLTRDCLVHFSYHDIRRALRNIRDSGSTFLLTTTFSDKDQNRDTITGGWRPLNFERRPFSFPEPVASINEKCTQEEGKYADKSLGLWRISDLPD